MTPLEICLIFGSTLAAAQFGLFVYIHRFDLGLAKRPAPIYVHRSFFSTFMDQNFVWLYVGLLLGYIIKHLSERDGF